MSKRLTHADIAKMSDNWARKCAQIKTLENERNAAIHPHQVAFENKTKPILDEYDPKIEKLQEQADDLRNQVLEWLSSQKKSVRVEGKKAIAEFEKGFRLARERVVNAEKFVAKCVERKIKDFWKYVRVAIKDAEAAIGKEDMDQICTRPKVPIAEATLTLKD